jgi:predicted DNA-binding protein with PD1-like motif
MGSLKAFVRERKVEAGSLSAIGAFSEAVLGYFDWQSKQYKKIPVPEQVEVLSLLGDVAVAADGPTLHVQAILGNPEGSTVGGHLLQARVRPTLEVVLVESASYLKKRLDPETGRALLSLGPA